MDSRLAAAQQKSRMTEEKVREMVAAARAEAAEAHMVLRKAVAAHAASIAAEAAEKKAQATKKWAEKVHAKMNTTLSLHLQKMEEELAKE